MNASEGGAPGRTTPREAKHEERAITRDREIKGGTPVFSGTRVPVEIMLDYLEDGQSIDDFLSHYPGISRELAVAALEEVTGMLVPSAPSPKK